MKLQNVHACHIAFHMILMESWGDDMNEDRSVRDLYCRGLMQWCHSMRSKGKSTWKDVHPVCFPEQIKKLFKHRFPYLWREQLFPFCGVWWSWDFDGVKGGETACFSGFLLATASEKVTEHIWGYWLKLSNWGEKLWDPPLCCLGFALNVQMHIFSGKRGCFFGEGVIPSFPSLGIPTVLYIHTHIHTKRD